MQIRIDAHVVRQLGEELITDHEQAILELVKNSYDADSQWCRIVIDTEFRGVFDKKSGSVKEVEHLDESILTQSEKPLLGRIVISDAGVGMNNSQIQKGWLTVSYSEKRKLKEEKRITNKFKRSIQGDKGLGRLSAMRLGNVLRIHSHNGQDDPVGIMIDWSEFKHGITLDEVPIYKLVAEKRGKGTEIAILGLSSIERWKGREAVQRVKAQLSSLISPFFDDDFKVALVVDGETHDLDLFGDELKEFVNVSSNFIFDGDNLFAEGLVKLPFFLPNQKSENENDTSSHSALRNYRKYIKHDDGENFLSTLKNARKLKSYNISRADDGYWYLSFKKTYTWNELMISVRHNIQPPGAFQAQWFSIVKRGLSLSSNELTKRQYTPELKAIADSLVGVGVYKNKFRVGHSADTDWIGFSKDTTSGRGFYSLRPNNVIGYISFEGYEGETLKETSDRQGFVEDERYHGFKVLTDTMKAFVNNFLNESRKLHSEYIRQCDANETVGDVSNFSATESVEKLEEITKNASAYQQQAASSKENLDRLTNSLKRYVQSEFHESQDKRLEVESFTSQLMQQVDKERYQQEEVVKHLMKLNFHAKGVLEELERFQERNDELLDSAAVGLSAESLAHDINPILADIQAAASAITKIIKQEPVNKLEVNKKTRIIKSHVSLVSKEISIINPMLRARRLRHSEFYIGEEISSFIDMKKDALSKKGVSISLSQEGGDKRIKMPIGKFVQIFDNLLRNSEYWVTNYTEKMGVNSTPTINIEQRDSMVFFYDNGPGIRSDLGNTIFDLYVSGKSEGSGLGLYIVKSILEQFKSTIDILPKRNFMGNYYVFYIDFKGAEV